MPDVLDFFNSDAFSETSLTLWVNRTPYVPSFLGGLGIFEAQGVALNSFYLERSTMGLELVQTRPRNTPGQPLARDPREAISYPIPHLFQEDAVTADEVQGLKALGMNLGLEDVQAVVNRKLMKMQTQNDFTHEFHRVGAFMGVILDADGSTLINLYTQTGISQPALVAWDIVNATDPELIAAVDLMRRTMEDNLQMGQGTVGQIIALCGDTFYDALKNHAAVRQSYVDWQAAAANSMGMFAQPGDFLRNSWVYNSFVWNGVLWHNYRGTNPNTGDKMIPAVQAYFAPVVDGLFHVRYGPRNRISGVNEIGLPRYSASRIVDDKYVHLEYESNPAYFCSRPEVIYRATSAAA